MEEKKFDLNSIIGFVLIFIILIGMLYLNKPSEEEIKAAEKAKQEQVDADAKKEANKPEVTTTSEEDYNVSDSLGMEKAKAQLGAFAFSAKIISPVFISIIFISNSIFPLLVVSSYLY